MATTIAQLIEYLQTLPPEGEVESVRVVSSGYASYGTAEEVKIGEDNYSHNLIETFDKECCEEDHCDFSLTKITWRC